MFKNAIQKDSKIPPVKYLQIGPQQTEHYSKITISALLQYSVFAGKNQISTFSFSSGNCYPFAILQTVCENSYFHSYYFSERDLTNFKLTSFKKNITNIENPITIQLRTF